MFTFFQQFPEVLAVISEKSDGSMKVFPERQEENRENREKFFAKQEISVDRVIGADIIHGTRAEIITSQNVSHNGRSSFIRYNGDSSNGDNGGDNDRRVIPGTDALVTKEKNLFLSVTVADCLPVFFYDPIAHVIGIAHSGWRGLIDGVLNKTLETMLNCGAQTENIFVSFGPSIRDCHFEIQNDILPQFARYEKYIFSKEGKDFVDLQGIGREQLQNAGVLATHIETSALCTFCEHEIFFSYRRDQPEEIQAMVAAIGMK
jgi:hypothetical protein